MRKSKNMFIIMAIVYLVIALLGFGSYISISSNILFGLSLSALLSGMNDTFENIKSINIAKNEIGFIVNITCGFLDNIISNNLVNTNPNVNIRNLKLNIESNCKNYKLAIHPNEYMKKHSVFMLNILSQVCFALSISAFVFSPFLPSLFQNELSVLLTLLAFSAMCFRSCTNSRRTHLCGQNCRWLRQSSLKYTKYSCGFFPCQQQFWLANLHTSAIGTAS